MELWDFLETILGSWYAVLTSLVSCYVLYLKQEWSLLGEPSNPAFLNRIRWLSARSYEHSYRAGLISFLDKFSTLLDDISLSQRGVSEVRRIQSALSYQSFDRLSMFTVVYPTFFFAICWLVGDFSRVAQWEDVFPDTTLDDKLLSTTLLIVACLLVYWNNTKRHVLKVFAATAFFWVSAFSGAIYLIGIVFLVTLAALVYRSRAFSHAFSLNSAVSFSCFYSVATAESGSVAGIVVGLSWYAGVVLGVHAVNRIVAALSEHDDTDLAKVGASWSFHLFALSACVVYVQTTTEFGLRESSVFVILFFGVLPLINGPFDWLSVAITRGLLYSIVNNMQNATQVVKWAAIDVIAAIFLLIGLVSVTWVAIEYVNWLSLLSGKPAALATNSILGQIRNEELLDDLWIWLIISSTLLPTVIHAYIALLSLNLALSDDRRDRAVRSLVTAWNTSESLKSRDLMQDASSVSVDMDARRYAFFHLTLVHNVQLLLLLVVTFVLGVLFLNMLGG